MATLGGIVLPFVGNVFTKIVRIITRSFSSALVIPRHKRRFRKRINVIRWWLKRILFIGITLLVPLDYYLIPILGNTLSEPRVKRPPKAPYGLPLVDTLPTQIPPAVDIVFVHGLGSFPDSTWEKSRQFRAADSSANNVNWIRDLLPVDLPAARLIFFNYDSTYYNDAPIKNLEDIADELLNAFHQQTIRNTIDELTRPIVFLCHSYGGLVVKEALNRAQRSPLLHQGIINNTYGTLYLGTPHSGTQYAAYQKAIATRLHRLGSNPDIFLPLEVNSTQLLNQHKAYLGFYEGRIRMINFFETHKQVIYRTPICGFPIKIMIVDKSSATFEALNTTNISLNTDHSGMNKHDNSEDNDYVLILAAIRNMMRSILIDRQNYRLARQAEEVEKLEAAKQKDYQKRCPTTKHYLVHPQSVLSYVERTSLMTQLSRLMEEPDDFRSPPRSVSLWGAGGAGKSQLALRYLEKNRKRFDPIIWVDASSPASAIKSYTNAFRELNLDYPINIMDERYKEATSGSHYLTILEEDWIIPTVMRELETRTTEHCRWLVVLDNADDVYWLPDLIPRGLQGSVIVTSRDMAVREFTSHAIEVDELTTDEGIDLLLSHIDALQDNRTVSTISHDDISGLRKEALPIVDALDHSALLLDLAGRLVSNHPYIRENISKYLDYHERFSFSVLNNSQQLLLHSYPFTLATTYEISHDTIRNFSTNATEILNVFAFLNSGLLEDRLFQEAAVSLVAVQKLYSTWIPLLLILQITLFSMGPKFVIQLLIHFCPWTPRLNDATKVLVERLMVFAPIILDVIYLTITLFIERSHLASGNVVTPRYHLAPYTIATLIYCSIMSTLPTFSSWILQNSNLSWTISQLPLVYTMTVLLVWGWTVIYYGFDSILEHHIKALVDRLDLSRFSLFQFEQALVGLHSLSREQLGVKLPGKLAWTIFWSFTVHVTLELLGALIMVVWLWLCQKIISFIQSIEDQRWYWKVLYYTLLIVQTPTGLLFAFMAGYGISGTGIIEWRPWNKHVVPEGFIRPDFINSILTVNGSKNSTWDPFLFEEAVAILERFSMIHRSPRTGYTMHASIQWWAGQRLDPAKRAAWIAEVTRFITLVYHSKNCFNDLFCQQLIIPHLIAIASADVANDGTQYWRLKNVLQMLYRSLKMVGRI